jgi:hypothetical protein
MIRALVACSLVGLAIVGLPTHGQAPAEYRASVDTLQYQSTGFDLMWFVQGRDTLGQPVTTRFLELHSATDSASGLQYWVRMEEMGGTGFESEKTYSISRSGRVLAVDGRPVDQTPQARVDFLPRLPEPPVDLRPGLKWEDTVSVAYDHPYGPAYYKVRRTYRVERALDTLNTTAFLFVGDGEVRFRQGGWQDSIRGIIWWQEVEGPVTDSVWFDTRAGRLIRDRTTLSLVGTGGAGTAKDSVVMPSGLRSNVVRVLTLPH